MKILNRLAIFVLAAVAFGFYRFVFQNAVNTPYFDDYAYLEYIIKLSDAPNLWEFLNELERKHNGHGVITAKLVVWLDWLLTGQVNFRTLILVGSTLVLMLVGYFWKILQANGLSFFYLLPVGLFLFTPAYHENIFWAAALWQYIASFVMGILTYYLLAKNTKTAFWGAIAAGFLLTYTNGNGLFGMYIGAVIPLLQQRYRSLLIWLLACVATTFIYYYRYPFGFGSLGQEKNAYHSLLTLLSFFGAAASYFRQRLPEVAILGGLISGLLMVLGSLLSNDLMTIWRKIPLKKHSLLAQFTKNPYNLSLVALLAWLLITGLGVAVARAGQTLETPGRYMIYSVMSIVSLYIALLIVLPKRWGNGVAAGTMGIGLLFWLGTYLFAGPEVINFKNSLLADAYSLQHHRRVSGKLETMTNLNALRYFDEAVRRNIYVLPSLPFSSSLKNNLAATPTLSLPLTFDTDTLPAYGGIWIRKIKNTSLEPTSGDLFLVLQNETNTYLTAAHLTPHRNRRLFLQKQTYFGSGFEALIFAENIPSGRYRLGLLDCQQNNCQLSNLSQEIDL
ncbi:MAG: hypothetical protein ACK4GN_16195 [Runella sp.]